VDPINIHSDGRLEPPSLNGKDFLLLSFLVKKEEIEVNRPINILALMRNKREPGAFLATDIWECFVEDGTQLTMNIRRSIYSFFEKYHLELCKLREVWEPFIFGQFGSLSVRTRKPLKARGDS